MKFQNFARSHFDFGVNILAQSQFKMKKKLFLQKLRSQPREDMFKMLNRVLYSGKSLSIQTLLYLMRHAYDFDKALRFYVKDVPKLTDEMVNTDISILLRHSDSIIVETFVMGETPVTIELTRNFSTPCIDAEYAYRVDIVPDVKTIIDEHKENYPGLTLPVEMSIEPACTLFIAEDFKEYIVTTGRFSLVSRKAKDPGIMTVDEAGYRYEVNILKRDAALDENSEIAFNTEGFCSTLASVATRALVYTAYMYANRGSLTRKNGKARKSYEHSQVHHVHKESAVVEDKLVPLHEYVKEYEPSEHKDYKGGHHASPAEHDRRAYYRRSRGVGDYDLVDGSFVNVGKGNGKYSLVRSTHVDGTKTKKVYKI